MNYYILKTKEYAPQKVMFKKKKKVANINLHMGDSERCFQLHV